MQEQERGNGEICTCLWLAGTQMVHESPCPGAKRMAGLCRLQIDIVLSMAPGSSFVTAFTTGGYTAMLTLIRQAVGWQ